MSERTLQLLYVGSVTTQQALHDTLAQRAGEIVLHHARARSEVEELLAREHFSVLCCEHDEVMPVLELVELLKDQRQNTPLIILTDSSKSPLSVERLIGDLGCFVECDMRRLHTLPRIIDACLERARCDQQRRDIERRMMESEERYLDIFNNTSDLIQCVATDGSFIYTNNAWRDTLGYSEEEVARLHLNDVLHPESMVCCQGRFQRLLNGETLRRIDFKFRTKAGGTVHLAGDCGAIVKEGRTVSTRGIFKNITDTVLAEEALRVSDARYQALYDNAPDIYSTIGAAGQILSINRAGAHLLGYQPEELIGESAAKVIHPEDQRQVFALVQRQFSGQALNESIEYRKVRKDGSTFWVSQRVTLDPGTDGARLLVICRDVTERRKLEEKLAHQAAHDLLTGLVNRREFEHRLLRLLASDGSGLQEHVLCFMDLDQFKNINDSAGHIAGDELLRQVASLLEGHMRSRDTLARLGGDEFAIIMEHCSLEDALTLCEELRETIAGFQFHWRTAVFTIGVSIGIVPILPGRSVIDTLSAADAVCYRAKREGRNRVLADFGEAANDE